MAAEAICDGCGKRSPMYAGKDHHWHKPESWYERSDEKGIQTACSRECINKIAKETGSTRCVLPVLWSRSSCSSRDGS